MGVSICTGVCSNKSQLNQQQNPDSKSNRGRSNDEAEGEETPALTVSFTERTVDHRIFAFQNAIASGKESTAQFLIDENPKEDLLNCKNMQNQQCTPLMIAVQSKRYSMIHFLLEHGAKVNEQNEFDETALHIASENGDLEAVKLLCRYDVDKSLVNDKGETALDIALYNDGKEFRSIARALEPDKVKLKQMKADSQDMTNNRLMSFTNGVLGLSPNQSEKNKNEARNQVLQTTHLTGVVDDLFADIAEEVEQQVKELSAPKAWLEKQQASLPYSWQRRWVVVFDGHMLWSDRMIATDMPLTEQEKRRWNTTLSLANVTAVRKVTGDSERKFVVKVKKRDYLFRCETQSSRDWWVKSVRQHCKVLEKAALFSSQDTIVYSG